MRRHEEQETLALPPGVPAPDFKLHSTPDQLVSLKELGGNPVILAFDPADWSSVWRSNPTAGVSPATTHHSSVSPSVECGATLRLPRIAAWGSPVVFTRKDPSPVATRSIESERGAASVHSL